MAQFSPQQRLPLEPDTHAEVAQWTLFKVTHCWSKFSSSSEHFIDSGSDSTTQTS